VFSFVKRRSFVVLIGFLLIALFIWIAGPLFAFAGYQPLESVFARLVAIGVVVVCWLLSAALRRFRARQASAQLAGAVLRQAPVETERVSPEATKLRQRFEEAVATLTGKGRNGRSLYDLPWYIFIGAPGSGKTTALVNSGLRFPLEQRVGKAAVRGVGGTRNCDWWFTDDAVFLDTAGRYTTQDSDATSDSEGWKEFLALLRKYRKRRPINGIILTLSAQDLMTLGEAGREAHVEAAHHRLRELAGELRIELPVYVMVTKCDVVAGFVDYFDDLPVEGRGQVWGVTFPYEQTLSGDAADAYPGEFDALMERLNARLFPRVEETRGVRQRAGVFAFPQQMAALREPLTQFISDVFAPNRLDRKVLLRGVYFTSGTQDGTQIDRLLGAIGRRFGIAPDAVAAPPGRGKAYFVERLLKQVVIGESGLAGINRRMEARNAAWTFGAYAAVALVVALGVTVFSASYSANRTYLGEVAADVAALQRVPPAPAAAMSTGLLPRLDAVRAVSESANRYREHAPWIMRWGLFQGTSIGNAARDTYQRELDTLLLPRFEARVRQRLVESAAEPELLFEYLKGYVMLGDPRHLDKKHLQLLADQEWKPTAPAGGGPVSLATHFASLLEYRDVLRPMPIDPALVAQARSSIRQAVPRIMYGRLQRSFGADTPGALRLDTAAGLGIEKVFYRRSGRRLSDPLPSLYTKAVFKEVTAAGMVPLATRYAEDAWVWGEQTQPANFARLLEQVTDLYEQDYIRAWDEVLNDLEVSSFRTVPQYSQALDILVGPTSPLKFTLQAVTDNTTFVVPASATPAPATPSIPSQVKEVITDAFSQARKKLTGRSGIPPGTAITAHFQAIHRMVAGSPAPIDGVLDQMRKIRDQLQTVGAQVGGTSELAAVTDPALLDLWRTLRRDAANLPPPLDRLVGQVARNVSGVVSFGATTELTRLYQDDVVNACRGRLEGRYPFSAVGIDVPLSDFAEVFGPGGVYDKFFAAHLDKLVDRTRTPWAWRPDSVASPEEMQPMLAQFERVARIRRMFFPGDAKTPKLSFVVGLSHLDMDATRFYVTIDGQNIAIKPGDQNGRTVEWPSGQDADPQGRQGGQEASAVFEDRIAAPVRALAFTGPWAWFHFVDATMDPAQLQAQADADLFTVLTVRTNQHRARITIQAQNRDPNPFAVRDWRRFMCVS